MHCIKEGTKKVHQLEKKYSGELHRIAKEEIQIMEFSKSRKCVLTAPGLQALPATRSAPAACSRCYLHPADGL